jgi:hypothetical protein
MHLLHCPRRFDAHSQSLCGGALFPDRQPETQLLSNLTQRACEVPDQVVERRRRDPESLGSLWHGRIVDWLQVNRGDDLGVVRRGLPKQGFQMVNVIVAEYPLLGPAAANRRSSMRDFSHRRRSRNRAGRCPGCRGLASLAT